MPTDKCRAWGKSPRMGSPRGFITWRILVCEASFESSVERAWGIARRAPARMSSIGMALGLPAIWPTGFENPQIRMAPGYTSGFGRPRPEIEALPEVPSSGQTLANVFPIPVGIAPSWAEFGPVPAKITPQSRSNRSQPWHKPLGVQAKGDAASDQGPTPKSGFRPLLVQRSPSLAWTRVG